MFILHPDKYLLPDYKISPFQTKDITLNNNLPDDDSIDSYFKNRFNGREFIYTSNGRSALYKALAHYQLQKDDVVTILTTSGNFYVSSCVTGEVEKFCSWNREVTAATRVIIVVHEFGYPYPELNELKKLAIPIIEDCAYAFFSEDQKRTIGRTGDFCLYSFPKMFALQVGGLLTYPSTIKVDEEQWPQPGMERYIKNVLSHYVDRKEEISQQRLENYNWLKRELEKLGSEERFELEEGVVPGVFMFRVLNEQIKLPELKEYLFSHGIQCSVFYGEQAFFIPNHQALDESDLRYFVSVIQSFLTKTLSP
jgi:hypothetical protein